MYFSLYIIFFLLSFIILIAALFFSSILELPNKIWMKFHKDLSPEYQRGYHKLFLPLVKIAKKNIIVKKILEHIAVHSTIDMRQSMRGKTHLLGRIYRKILLPLCYWVGKNG